MSESPTPQAESFRALYVATVDQVTGYALRRVASPEDAADVVAETYLAAWRRTLDLPVGDEARLWLYGVARRVIANHRRGALRRERLGWRLRDELAGATVPDPADDVVDTRAVRVAMDRLGELDREVLRLTVWEHLEPREVARVLEISPEAARARLSRARARLRSLLRPAVDPAERVTSPRSAGRPASSTCQNPEEQR